MHSLMIFARVIEGDRYCNFKLDILSCKLFNKGTSEVDRVVRGLIERRRS